jgi:sterol desaturase/sphingolipid hydroxylase (fatty acid hydroxylase superfamily)
VVTDSRETIIIPAQAPFCVLRETGSASLSRAQVVGLVVIAIAGTAALPAMAMLVAAVAIAVLPAAVAAVVIAVFIVVVVIAVFVVVARQVNEHVISHAETFLVTQSITQPQGALQPTQLKS